MIPKACYYAAKHPPTPIGRVSDVRAEVGKVMKPGHVYFVLGLASGLIKIGYAKDAWARMSSMQVGCPEELGMMGVITTYLPESLERDLHAMFAEYRVRGEWFRCGHPIVDYITVFRDRDEED
jgi:hypothetical protein